MRILILLFLILVSCKDERVFSKRSELFWPRFRNMYSIKVTNSVTKKIIEIADSGEIFYIKVNKLNNTCKFLEGSNLLGEYLVEIDTENTAKENKLTDNIYLKLYQGTELKYSLRMQVSEVFKNEPIKWEVSNLMNFPYNISNDTLKFEYKYLNDD